MKKIGIILTIVAAINLAACGGRTPNPVMVSQFSDQNKTCKALEFDMKNVQDEIQRLFPKTDKTGKNVVLGVTGYFLIVPLFFMDFKNADKTEYEAYRQRYNHLASLAMSKNCSFKPETYPSVKEMEEQYKNMKKKQKSQQKKP